MARHPQKPENVRSAPRFRSKKSANQSETDISKITEPIMLAIKDGLPFISPDLDDRAVVTIAGSLLEEWLKVAMLVRFRRTPTKEEEKQIFRSNGGPLTTFSNRINVCALMGIVIGDMRHDLDIIRSIRNDFAHTYLPISFDRPDIKTQCDRLLFKRKIENGITNESRRNFVSSASTIFVALNQTILRAMVESHCLAENAEAIEAHPKKLYEQGRRRGAGK